MQRLVARLCAAPTAGQQQAEPIVEHGLQALQSEGIDARRGQFDGQRHAVELPADRGDAPGIGIVEAEAVQRRRRALDEQLHRGPGGGLGCTEQDIRGGSSSGPSRVTHSPLDRKGSRLVASRCTCGAVEKMRSARRATASTTCSQLSSTSNSRLPARCSASSPLGSSWRAGRPSAEASALGTSIGC